MALSKSLVLSLRSWAQLHILSVDQAVANANSLTADSAFLKRRVLGLLGKVPPGMKLAVAGFEALYIVDASSGAVDCVEAHGHTVHCVTWSPSGQAVASLSESADGGIGVHTTDAAGSLVERYVLHRDFDAFFPVHNGFATCIQWRP